MMELKPCPCGKTPTEIDQYGQDWDKWVFAVPNCCSEWMIEYRSDYEKDPDKQKQNAIEAWNNAPRLINRGADNWKQALGDER